MLNKQMLQGLINERLLEAAGDIFSLFEQAVAEYQREIDRLKNVSEAKPVMVDIRDARVSLGTAMGEESEDIFGSLDCNEEAEQVVIKQEDEPQIPITTEKSNDELQSHGQQMDISEEAGGGAEAKISFESEEEDFETGNLESEGAKQPFSCSVPNPELQMTGDKRRVAPAASSETLKLTPGMKSPGSTKHWTIHAGPQIARPFSCTICPRRFKLKITQEAHMRAHAGGNPRSCAECGLTFKNQSYMINHIYRVHTTTNEKPIQCTICNKGFLHQNAFKMHMDSHMGERPFRCALCGKGFTQKGTLKRHMVSHTGEKPYNCSQCGKDYSTKQNLTKHMAKNH